VERSASGHRRLTEIPAGGRTHIHSHRPRQGILAELPEGKLCSILTTIDLVPVTRARYARPALPAPVRQLRPTGYSVDDEEN